MITCPDCSTPLKPILNSTKEEEWEDIDFICENNHVFFVRLKEDDLMRG